MTEEFAKWAVDRLLEELRQRQLPSIPAREFVWEPFLSVLRAAVQRSDRDVVLALINDPAGRMFGGLLSRGLPEDDEITVSLLTAFNEESDLERKIGLVQHVTARDLEPKARDQVRSWIGENFEAFVADQRAMFGGPDGPANIRQRLEDPAFSRKRWQYLYSAHALQDRAMARELISSYLVSEDAFVRSTAEDSLDRLERSQS